jgi:phage terminase small subunit
MKTKALTSSAPAHLSPAMAAWWRSLCRRYKFQPQHLRVLEAACDSWDRTVAARAEVLRDGLTVPNRFGELRPHPSLATERDNRIAFVRCVRELALADDDLPRDSRPPRLTGRYAGRD